MSDEIGQIYPLFPEGDGDYPTRKVKPEGFCAHRQTQFNTTSRRVHCVQCGEEVDAFTVLAQLAADRERLSAHRDHIVRTTRIAEARLSEIKRQEKNAKARMRRANIELDSDAVFAVEREAHNALRAAPAVGGGAVDPLTVAPPETA